VAIWPIGRWVRATAWSRSPAPAPADPPEGGDDWQQSGLEHRSITSGVYAVETRSQHDPERSGMRVWCDRHNGLGHSDSGHCLASPQRGGAGGGARCRSDLQTNVDSQKLDTDCGRTARGWTRRLFKARERRARTVPPLARYSFSTAPDADRLSSALRCPPVTPRIRGIAAWVRDRGTRSWRC
jgi:hypothetical protein